MTLRERLSYENRTSRNSDRFRPITSTTEISALLWGFCDLFHARRCINRMLGKLQSSICLLRRSSKSPR